MSKTDLVPATTTTNVPARLQPVSAADEYTALKMSPQQYMETLKENMGSSEFTRGMLTRIKYPSNDTRFTITDDLLGEEEDRPELRVILLAVQPTRTLWVGKYEPGSTEPPACRSYDGDTGFGKYGVDTNNPENPSGLCDTCPMAKFKSAANGVGQACQLKNDLYFLMPDSMTPYIMTLPVTSGTPLKKFRKALTDRGIALYGAVVSIKPIKEKGKAYSVASFGLVQTLPENEIARLREYAQNVREHLIYGPAIDDDEEGTEGAGDSNTVGVAVEELPF